MKEFPLNIPLGGLAAQAGTPGNEMLLGLRPIKNGLESVEAPRLTTALVKPWPFPQIFQLNEFLILATADGLYKSDGTPILLEIPNAGYPWSMAIVGDFIVATNNKVVVKGRGYALELDTEHLVPVGRSICEVGGQFIIGAPWAYNSHQPGMVMWGNIGVADFTISEGNTAGIRYAKVGNVLSVFPQVHTTLSGMKFGFAVFGTAGVATFFVEDHPIMYTQKKISEIGIYSQLAVAGTSDTLFFVGTNYKLYAVKDLKPQELGYEAQFKQAGSEIVLSYDANANQLWAGF